MVLIDIEMTFCQFYKNLPAGLTSMLNVLVSGPRTHVYGPESVSCRLSMISMVTVELINSTPIRSPAPMTKMRQCEIFLSNVIELENKRWDVLFCPSSIVT